MVFTSFNCSKKIKRRINNDMKMIGIPISVPINKVLLATQSRPLLTHCPQGLSGSGKDRMDCKSKIFSIWSATGEVW